MNDLVEEEFDCKSESIENSINEEAVNSNLIKCGFDYFEALSDPKENEKLKEVELWDFPKSYRICNNEETNILSFIENFNLQYVNLYPQTNQLLLMPYNECNIKKFVCSTVIPTLLKYNDLFVWEKCSRFVSDYLSLELLSCPYKLPRTLFSPNTVLGRQCGNSFEYSTVLCSLLLGAGYDAYIVNGRATREICQMVEIHKEKECPEPIKLKENHSQNISPSKYTIKPQRTLTSRYLKSQKEKEIKKADQEEEEAKENAKIIQKEREMPEFDDLFGYRVHSWILICSGKREITEPFFIDPLTGNGMSVKDPNFLLIDSLWNDNNYWVCLSREEGISSLSYDLKDSTVWEPIFPKEGCVSKSLVDDYIDEDLEDIIEEEKPKVKRVQFPKPWCEKIHVDLKDYKTHNKNSKRISYYNRRRIEKFTPYSMPNGLTKRITEFSDYEQNEIISVEDNFANRVDRVYKRTTDYKNNTICELFESGRPSYLKEHQFSTLAGESKRIMRFYNNGRLDCLKTSEIGPFGVVEYYEGRDDFMFYRKVDFAKKTIKFKTPDSTEGPPRTILKIQENFERNKNAEADKDIAELIFDSKNSKIYVKYHVAEENIFAATHIFVKSSSSNDKISEPYFDDDMHISFHPKTSSTKLKTSKLYELLLLLVQHENKSKTEIYESEREIKSILEIRMSEEAEPKLTTCHFDLLRSKDIKKIRMDLEEAAMREEIRKKEMQSDYLGPYLALFDDPTTITYEQATRIREMCLNDLKATLVKRANYIQTRFETQTEELKKKQKWYQNNQITLSKEEEIDYIKYCSEAMFKINIFEQRLQRHKLKSLVKYKDMVKRLDSDKRLDV